MNADTIKFIAKPGATVGVYSCTNYVRDFRAQPAPWECTRQEWETYLYPSGLFDIVDAKKDVGVGDGAKAKDR